MRANVENNIFSINLKLKVMHQPILSNNRFILIQKYNNSVLNNRIRLNECKLKRIPIFHEYENIEDYSSL